MNKIESKDETISRILVEKGVQTEEQIAKVMKLPCEAIAEIEPPERDGL